MRAIKTSIASAAAVALLAAPGVVSTASAATGSAVIATPNGVTGVPQTIEVRAPQFAGQTIALSVSNAAGAVGSLPVSVNASGSGSAVWTPPGAGSWKITGQGTFASAEGASFAVAATPTRTTLYSANQAQINAGTTMVASVQALAGNIAPQGSVTFSLNNGTALETIPLRPGTASTSIAYFSWTPTSTGTTTIVATYNPIAGVAGQGDMTSSTSSNTIESVDTNPLVTLRLPSSYRIGVPVDLTAVVNNIGLQGSAAFKTNINGDVLPLSGSVPLVGSTATTSWTPTIGGNQILSTNFSSSNTVASGSAQQWINVGPALPVDTVAAGPAQQGTWPTKRDIPVSTNAKIPMAITVASGAPAIITESGPCLVSGNVLIAPASAGTCTVTVSSPGTTAYAPASVTYTFEATAPKKKRR